MRHPAVPESLDGWSILHRMFRFKRREFGALKHRHRRAIAAEAAAQLAERAAAPDTDAALAQLLGHKADLMLTEYAHSFDALGAAQTAFDGLELAEYLEPAASYVSVLEVGLYEATGKIHADLAARGLKAHSSEWNAAFDASMAEQAANPRIAPRLWAKVPQRRYVCFYPMDKRRGETVNWYTLPYEERAALMLDHGKIGRSFHGLVTQVISGSIGFDDWEWGVDLYADSPDVFKKLIYEMRFDEASSKYAGFGQFYTGMQFSVSELERYLEGDGMPALVAAPAASGDGRPAGVTAANGARPANGAGGWRQAGAAPATPAADPVATANVAPPAEPTSAAVSAAPAEAADAAARAVPATPAAPVEPVSA